MWFIYVVYKYVLSTLRDNLSYSVFLTISFLTTLLNLAISSKTGVNFPMYNLSSSVFKLARFLMESD